LSLTLPALSPLSPHIHSMRVIGAGALVFLVELQNVS